MKIAEEIEIDWGLGLHESVVALIELVLQALLVAVRGDSEHLSPQAVVLTVREPEYIRGAYTQIEMRFRFTYQ